MEEIAQELEQKRQNIILCAKKTIKRNRGENIRDSKKKCNDKKENRICNQY